MSVYYKNFTQYKNLPEDGHVLIIIQIKIKVKQSRNSPSVAQRVPGGLGPQIS